MSNKPKRKKRPITPPLRSWPPIPSDDESSDGEHSETLGRSKEEIGLAGADDIVQWLAVLMNEKGISFEELDSRSGIPKRTIIKWFSANLKERTMPNLRTIQACFEALGQSLIATGPSVPIGEDQHIFPIENFRRVLLEKWLEQTANTKGLSIEDLIKTLNEGHKQAILRGIKGHRWRVL